MFFIELDPPLAYYIKEHYSLDNLRFPAFVEDDFVEKNFEVLLRYFNPE